MRLKRLLLFLALCGSGTRASTYLPVLTQAEADFCQKNYSSLLAKAHDPRLVSDPPDANLIREKRAELTNYLTTKKIPFFLRDTESGPLPIVLLNKHTYEELGYLLDQSMGMVISQHPGRGTDHGWIRNRTVLLDLYNPNTRESAGEIHATGIAWKDLSDYLPMRKPGSRIMLDQAFLLSPEERNIFDLYHRVRRAALYRAKYDYYHDKYPRESFWKELPHFLWDAPGEHCYTFPLGYSAQSYCSAMLQWLKGVGFEKPEAFMKTPEFDNFYKIATKTVLSADWRDGARFNYHDLLNRPENFEALAKQLPPNLTHEQLIQVLSYLVSVRATSEYVALLHKLDVPTQEMWKHIDFERPRGTALFIYDDTPGIEKKFFDATYSSKSDRYSFPGDKKNRAVFGKDGETLEKDAKKPVEKEGE